MKTRPENNTQRKGYKDAKQNVFSSVTFRVMRTFFFKSIYIFNKKHTLLSQWRKTIFSKRRKNRREKLSLKIANYILQCMPKIIGEGSKKGSEVAS